MSTPSISQQNLFCIPKNTYLEKIYVFNLRNNKRHGNVRAFADVKIDNFITIHGVKIIQQDGQQAYCRLPDTQSNGHWFPIISTDNSDLKAAISKAVLTAWGGMTE